MPHPGPVPVYLEIGTKRVFAGSLEWPGWCRSGRDEATALEALASYAPRYEAAIGQMSRRFASTSSVESFEVIERLEGNATTDFGAPGITPSGDRLPLDSAELDRLTRLLRACWSAFDDAVAAAVGVELRKGPRGGGRGVDAMVAHVLEADRAYLAGAGGRARKEADADVAEEMAGVRNALLEAVAARARGEPAQVSSRRKAPLWTPRYTVRRSAWHALDHAWEIQDRAIRG